MECRLAPQVKDCRKTGRKPRGTSSQLGSAREEVATPREVLLAAVRNGLRVHLNGSME